jgi:T-complex protein 1 subunit delta
MLFRVWCCCAVSGVSAAAPKANLSNLVSKGAQGQFASNEKQKDVRRSNITAAKSEQKHFFFLFSPFLSRRFVSTLFLTRPSLASRLAQGVADCVRTSLGPRGMDKMITAPNGEVTITNDGATILQKLKVQHPAAKMFVELSKSQDVEAGDGTTSVVVLAGALAGAAELLLDKGIHPAVISSAFLKAERRAQQILLDMSLPIERLDEEHLLGAASTSLNSKVVNQYSQTLAPIAVKAVLKVIDPVAATNVDLRDIRVVQKLGGTVEDTELVEGLVFTHKTKQAPGAPHLVKDAKIALLQFCLSAPKTNIENNVVVSDYTQMDRLLKEERRIILDLCKAIQKTGANVLLLQKSILRDATSELALHFLAKLKIMVVADIERGDIELICKSIGCQPIASVEGLAASKLGRADLVEEEATSGGAIVRITGTGFAKSEAAAAAVTAAAAVAAGGAAAPLSAPRATSVCVLVRGSNPLVVAEAERSLHDALCVVRSLVKCRRLTPGGGAPEIEMALRLSEWARTLAGLDAYCIRAFAEALELVPYTLAENSGLNPIEIVTALRAKHAAGGKHAGINVRLGTIVDSIEGGVVQPLLVNSSALNLAVETIVQLLKIDDLVGCR